ncbi:MAG: hypothetical protein CMN30_05220 [Sandaracinus sp.]|nr:hypothetical protein [Sandaracinus sp.]
MQALVRAMQAPPVPPKPGMQHCWVAASQTALPQRMLPSASVPPVTPPPSEPPPVPPSSEPPVPPSLEVPVPPSEVPVPPSEVPVPPSEVPVPPSPVGSIPPSTSPDPPSSAGCTAPSREPASGRAPGGLRSAQTTPPLGGSTQAARAATRTRRGIERSDIAMPQGTRGRGRRRPPAGSTDRGRGW